MLTITYITMLRLILICSTVKFVGFYGQWGMVWDGGQSMFRFRYERDDHNPHSMGPSTMIQSASMAATRKSSTWCVSQFRDVFLRS